MEEAQRLADRVAVLAGGRLIADAAPGALRSEASLVTFRLPAGVSAAVRGYELEALTVTRPSLEDVYLELTA
jgi:ABC-2 type transport system ATP-binding protein